jgi:hypothetical protein
MRLAKLGSNLLLAFALFLLSLGLVRGFAPVLARPVVGLRPLAPVQSVGEVGMMARIDVAIPIENTSSRPVTILGSEYICYRPCCVTYADTSKQIPAHSEGSVRVRLYTKKTTGDFQVPVTLYTDLDGQSELKVELQGKVLEAIESPR